MQTISKKKGIKRLQYFLIYWLLLDAGSAAVAVISTDVYFLSLLGIGVSICFFWHNRLEFKLTFKYRFQIFAVIFAFLLILNFIITTGGTPITVVLMIVGRLFIVFATILLDRENFTTRFVRVVTVLAAVSLVIYIGYVTFGTSFWNPITSLLYHQRRDSLSLGDQYGLFFLVFNYFDPTRNTYIFGEPGEYQLVLSTALFLLLNLKTDFEEKKRKWIIVILVITLITTQSTSGYLSLFIILVCAVLNNQKWNSRYFGKNRKIILVLIIIALCYFMMFSNGIDMWNKVIREKLFDESGALSFDQSTGMARWDGFRRLWNYAKENPLGVLVGIGFYGRGETTVTSCNGFTNSILDFGIITMFWMVGSFMSALYRYTNHNFMTMLAGIFIIMNTWFGQPVPLYTLMIVIAFTPMFLSNSQGGIYGGQRIHLQGKEEISQTTD